MKTITLAACMAVATSLILTAAPAEARKRHGYRGASGITENNTGGRPGRVISRGPTGASTISRNSAAAGNAQRPELAVPNGSAGGGGR